MVVITKSDVYGVICESLCVLDSRTERERTDENEDIKVLSTVNRVLCNS